MRTIENKVGFTTLVKREILRFFVVFSQTILPPLISSSLYLFVFGLSIGRNIDLTAYQGLSYIQFIVPGLVMMHLIEGSYTNTSSSLFISRWHNIVQEILLSPLSYFEMVLGLLIGGIARGMITGAGVYLVSLFFTHFPIPHPWLVLYFFITVTTIFSCLGLLVGLWADGFEKLSVWGTFVLTPLIYFGGVFHSIHMVPSPLQWATRLNPIFYLVNGLRYGMLGVADASVPASLAIAAFLAVALFCLVERLFRAGYKLRS
ncbi:MAG: ABC transporter permease [Candidatus Omnitrophica bacterium]|nr:ABC transporter permease [Candidatus Omnitrophota bacterium]